MTIVELGEATSADPIAPAQSGAEALIQLFVSEGVDYLFLCPGTDTAPLQEALVALEASGQRVPKVVPCLYENVALAAAHGYFQVTGRPQVAVVHVDVGTQNLGGNLHNCQRGHGGVVILAGRAPYTVDGDVPGARSIAIQWLQDQPDQIGIVRNYVKWSTELARTDTLHRAVPRAFQMAASEPAGPVYMMVAREVLMQPMDGVSLGVSRRTKPLVAPAGDPSVLEEIARWLVDAAAPLVVTGYTGRQAEAVGGLVALAELLSLPVADVGGYVSFPTSHRLFVTATPERIAAADVILLLDVDVPWIPKYARPSPDARIAHIDIDPIKQSMPMWGFPVDLPVVASTAKALPALRSAAEAMATPERRAFWEARTPESSTDASHRRRTSTLKVGPSSGTSELESVAAVIEGAVSDDTLVLDEAVTSSETLRRCMRRDRPGSWLHSGAPGLGWALGAAIGAKLAAPSRDVVAVTGDGAFVFGSPIAALWAAQQANAPFLTVILNNRGYRASQTPVVELFPDGVSVKTDSFPGVRFPTPPDYAALARSCHAYGEQVEAVAELAGALERGLAATRRGQAAVLDVLLSAI